jgi:hypothetical protein
MNFKKIPYQVSSQVLPRFEASELARKHLDQDFTIAKTIEVMEKNELNNDLVQFMAHALPVREAIWWASLCLMQRKKEWNQAQIQCIEAAREWVQSPSEGLRRKSELLSNRLGLSCGPSWLAQAVFWNGSGSIVNPDLPSVMPDPFLYAKAVAGAINHASVLPVWDNSKQYYIQSLKYAMDIAKGGDGGEQ